MTTTTKSTDTTHRNANSGRWAHLAYDNVSPELIAFLEELGDDAEPALAEADQAAKAEIDDRIERCLAARRASDNTTL